MPRILGAIALAGRLRLSALPKPWGLAGNARTDDLQRMPVSGLGDSGHDLSGHTQAVEDVVSGNLVRHQSKERFQCYERAADLGLGELLDRLDLAAQTS